jgi:hypothetical protein
MSGRGRRRKDVPQDIQNEVPCPETWPSPTATWKSGASCDIPQKFGPQNLVINIAIVRFTTRWFQLAGIYDPLLVFV